MAWDVGLLFLKSHKFSRLPAPYFHIKSKNDLFRIKFKYSVNFDNNEIACCNIIIYIM